MSEFHVPYSDVMEYCSCFWTGTESSHDYSPLDDAGATSGDAKTVEAESRISAPLTPNLLHSTSVQFFSRGERLGPPSPVYL